MQSCLFEGRVRHTRSVPVAHTFAYRLYMLYLDLDELPEVFSGRLLWSSDRPAVARFRREDHVGDPEEPLPVSVRKVIFEETGRRHRGPIRLLTHLSYFGYCFNPVSFYYCFDEDDENLEWIVAEVTNTPWGERTCYVIPASAAVENGVVRHNPRKKMHVSPFMDMNVDYDWHFTKPDDRVTVFMANSQDGRRIFDAGLTMKRVEITAGSLARVLVTYPWMTAKVIAAIHWQALRLWLKRCPVYIHPEKKTAATSHSS